MGYTGPVQALVVFFKVALKATAHIPFYKSGLQSCKYFGMCMSNPMEHDKYIHLHETEWVSE